MGFGLYVSKKVILLETSNLNQDVVNSVLYKKLGLMLWFWVMTSQTHALPSTFRGRARKIWLISSQSGFTVWQIQTGFPIFFCCQGLLQGKLYHETNKLSRLLDFLVRFFDNMKQIVKANVVELALILSWIMFNMVSIHDLWNPCSIFHWLQIINAHADNCLQSQQQRKDIRTSFMKAIRMSLYLTLNR